VDVLLTIAFCVCSVIALAGALGSALLPSASPYRTLALLAVAVGTGGVLGSLSAGFAALVALVCLTTAAILVGARQPWPPAETPSLQSRWAAQVGALAAAALFVVLAYAAVRGDFVHGSYPGGSFGAAFLGRLLAARDAVTLVAVGLALLVGLTGGVLRRSGRP
jgi:hypothetical protein